MTNLIRRVKFKEAVSIGSAIIKHDNSHDKRLFEDEKIEAIDSQIFYNVILQIKKRLREIDITEENMERFKEYAENGNFKAIEVSAFEFSCIGKNTGSENFHFMVFRSTFPEPNHKNIIEKARASAFLGSIAGSGFISLLPFNLILVQLSFGQSDSGTWVEYFGSYLMSENNSRCLRGNLKPEKYSIGAWGLKIVEDLLLHPLEIILYLDQEIMPGIIVGQMINNVQPIQIVYARKAPFEHSQRIFNKLIREPLRSQTE